MFKVSSDVDSRVFETLIKILKDKPIPINKYRSNSGTGRSQCWGIVKQRNCRYAGSRMNYERPEIYREILRIAAAVLPPDFSWTSCQLNQNYQTAEHKDVGNAGESAIIGFGDYVKGELKIEETTVSIKNRIVYFDGSLYNHSTCPWEGERFSLVYHRPVRTFKEIPRYSVIEAVERGRVVLHLQEELGGVTRVWRPNRTLAYCSDGVMVQTSARKPTLRECVEE